jgi:subtilisin family serine protease
MTFPARRLALLPLVLAAVAAAILAPGGLPSSAAWPDGKVIVRYSSPSALAAALRAHPARITSRIAPLRVAELLPAEPPSHFAAAVSKLPGILSVSPLHIRRIAADPGVTPAGLNAFAVYDTAGKRVRTPPDTYDSSGVVHLVAPFPIGSWPNYYNRSNPSGLYEWQWAATNEAGVSDAARRSASSVTIAIVDTGADLTAPDIAAKSPATWDVASGTTDVTDYVGHGTFVASLAAGAWDNNEGVAGFGGDAKLLIVKATDEEDGSLFDYDIANAVTYAADHGANIINLSLGGPVETPLEDDAMAYAANKGVLIVAAAGNSYSAGNPINFPAGVVQPVGTKGEGGSGLAVTATDVAGQPATYFDGFDTFQYQNPPGTYTDPSPLPAGQPSISGYKFPKQKRFASTGSFVSLAAPGGNVLGALSSAAVASAAIGEVDAWWNQVSLPGSSSGLYGFANGTSFSSPEVAGVAALVWGADRALTAAQVAGVIKMTAVQNPAHPAVSSASPPAGTWSETYGYGIVNAASAVAYAQAWAASPPTVALMLHASGQDVSLSWTAAGAPQAATYAVYVKAAEPDDDSVARYKPLVTGTTGSSTSYTLDPGTDYSFLVVAYDKIGTPLAASNELRASFTQQQPALTLAMAPQAAATKPLHYQLTAKLTSSDGATPFQSKTLALEYFDGYNWHRLETGTTKSNGTVNWTLVLRKPGLYKLRSRYVSFVGAGSATSQTVALSVAAPPQAKHLTRKPKGKAASRVAAAKG